VKNGRKAQKSVELVSWIENVATTIEKGAKWWANRRGNWKKIMKAKNVNLFKTNRVCPTKGGSDTPGTDTPCTYESNCSGLL
jgi:hypothetical protein